MYGYVSEYVPLTIENILLRVSQEDIFEHLLGEIPDVNKHYLSLVRDDNNPTCTFAWHGNKLMFLDFGNHKPHLDCFGVISQIEGLSFKESLEYVNIQFNLGLEGCGTLTKPKYRPLTKVDIVKNSTVILFKPRPFSLLDKKYWNQYGIWTDELIRDSVFPVLWYKFYSNRLQRTIIVRPKEITYGYYEFSPRIKIYSPLMPKTNGKWITNTTSNDVGGINDLPIKGDLLVITKSYKDNRCLRNFGINSVWFQNEGMIPDDDIIIMLCRRFTNIVVLFDNDETGVVAAIKVVSIINSHFPNKASSVTVPIMENITDPSDLYSIKGKYELLRFLSINNLI